MKAATLHRSDFVQQNAANTKTNTAQIWKEFQWNFGKPIAQLSFRTPYVYLPDDA
jgi:hypothetical protein